MLDKAVPRRVDDALRGEQTVAEWNGRTGAETGDLRPAPVPLPLW